MVKKLLVTFFILSLTNLTVPAECVTGYACSLGEIQEQQTKINQEKKNPEFDKTKNEKKDNKNKHKRFFVDGGKYNNPEYTEIFDLKGAPFIP